MNSVSAAVAGERLRPTVRTRRTALTYATADGARFDVTGTEFADLSRDPRRSWSAGASTPRPRWSPRRSPG
ncbi:hypothetical protein ACTD5D_32495 [Nocardia takedensis]|uniref:hypothetical protein n=1 Tax=Nocardia takedensis TaxID=259390 RepID=UPI003F76E9CC